MTSCLVIAKCGVKVVLRNIWILIALLFSWIPLLVFAGFFLGYEQYLESVSGEGTQESARRMFLADMAQGSPEFEVVQRGLTTSDSSEGRHIIWSYLMSIFLQIPQAISAMLVIGLIAPPLIARDIRTRAFLLYFSRPISRYEYVIGKMLVVSAFLAFITMGPVLVCYLFGLALSSDVTAIFDTWDLPLRAIIASAAFIIPSVSVALMFSSLTAETRFAGFAWFATWGLGAVAWQVMLSVMLAIGSARINQDFNEQAQQHRQERDRQAKELIEERTGLNVDGVPSLSDVIDGAVQTAVDEASRDERFPRPGQPGFGPPRPLGAQSEIFRDHLNREMFVDAEGFLAFVDPKEAELEELRRAALTEEYARVRDHPLSLVSMYHTLVRLQRWIFGLEPNFGRVLPSLLMTLFVTTGSLMILLRRVAAPIRV